jgi:hypothetical protein
MNAPQAIIWPPKVARSLEVLLLNPTMPLSKAKFARHIRRLLTQRATFTDIQVQEMEQACEVLETYFERTHLLKHHATWLGTLLDIQVRVDKLLKSLIDAEIKHEDADTMRETIKGMRNWSDEAMAATATQSVDISGPRGPWDSDEVHWDEIQHALDQLKPAVNFYRRILHDLETMVFHFCKVILKPDGVLKVLPIRYPWPARALRRQLHRWKDGVTGLRPSPQPR